MSVRLCVCVSVLQGGRQAIKRGRGRDRGRGRAEREHGMVLEPRSVVPPFPLPSFDASLRCAIVWQKPLSYFSDHGLGAETSRGGRGLGFRQGDAALLTYRCG